MSKVGSVNDSLQKNRDTISLLEKREALLMKKVNGEIAKARAYLKKGRKTQARQAMVRKKNYEKQRDRLVAQMTNLENINMKLEEANLQKDIYDAQVNGAQDLKKIQKKMGGVDKIEEKLDDIRDAMQDADELGEALAQNLGGTDIDDVDVMDELEELEKEGLDEDLMGLEELETPSDALKAPKKKVPGGGVKVMPKKVEDDFANLEAELEN